MDACPKCTHPHVVKAGKARGQQRWLCRGCGAQFTCTTPRGRPPWQKSLAVFLDGHVPRIAAIEIFAQGIGNTVGNPLPQCLADVEILTRNAQRHRDSSLIWAKPPAAVTGFSCGASPEPPTCPAGALNR